MFTEETKNTILVALVRDLSASKDNFGRFASAYGEQDERAEFWAKNIEEIERVIIEVANAQVRGD